MRRLNETFVEWRFAPKASHADLLGVILLSLGALALGAGIYAQWFWRAAEPPGYAPYVLAAGIVCLAAYAFYSPSRIDAVLVGDLGVGIEHDGRATRSAWYEIEKLTLAHDALVLKTPGKPLQIALADNAPAVRRVLAEALTRVPSRVEIAGEDVRAIGRPEKGDGERHEAEPPQVTEMTCRASDQPLLIERDVRMCSRCGALYHRRSVPDRCSECDGRLRQSF